MIKKLTINEASKMSLEELVKKYNVIGVYYGNHSFTLSDGRVI